MSKFNVFSESMAGMYIGGAVVLFFILAIIYHALFEKDDD